MPISNPGMFAIIVSLLFGLSDVPLGAQSTSTPTASSGESPNPQVAAADSERQIILRATRVTEPMTIDGKIDEAIYQQVEPVTSLLQMQPNYGAPETGATEAWILYDDENFYVTCHCRNGSNPMILDDMRRDLSNQGDYFSFAIDTFRDRRNSFLFYINPVGGLYDALMTDEAFRNESWNGVWEAKATRYDGGWIGEVAIPFKSLRYGPGRDQEWGIILRRRIRSNGDEHSFLPLVPQAWGIGAVGRVSRAATLVGLQAPPATLNLEVKPFVTAAVTSDRQASPAVSNEFGNDLGFDLKYGLSKNLTLDVTYNTDFAQVEADQTQVNLTRFSLFFPEKREFFLEGQGLFAFGGANTGGSNNSGGGSNNVPVMFFSRQIGLNQGRAVPIVGGGRLTGRVGRYSIGTLGVRTGEDPVDHRAGTSFGVVRVKGDLLRQSSVGALVTHRSTDLTGDGSSQLFGVDGLFTFFDNLHFTTYAAKTESAGHPGDDFSYRAQMDYDHDRYGLRIDRLVVGQNFNPQVGFTRRQDFKQILVRPRFSPRPRVSRRVRQWNYIGSFNYVTNNQNQLESRTLEGEFQIDLRNSDSISAQFNSNYEQVRRPFSISDDVVVPSAAYDFANFRVAYTGGQQRRLSGTAAMERGSFYGGTKTTASFNGRVKFGFRFSIEPLLSADWIELPQQTVTATVVSTRTNYSFTPRMFFSGLLQYNSTSSSLAANLRFRWEYQPGSDFFIVYTEGRDTLQAGMFPLENRGVAVKLTRLIRF